MVEKLSESLDSKPWYFSLGATGAILTKLIGVAQIFFGFEVVDSAVIDQTAMVIVGIATLVSGAMSLIGRIRAKTAITFTKGK